MEAELHVDLYFKKIRNHSFKCQKNLKKNPGCRDNDEIYKRVKSQCEILCIVDYIKMTKSDRDFFSEFFET
jgi:hypothetical protein